MEISESRQFYPYLSTGRIYMNHAAISPLSLPVVESLNEYIFVRSQSEIENYMNFMKTVVETKKLIGELINAPSERIAFVENTSNGLNILAQGLSWQPGDRIILNDIEFPSNIYPFLNLKSEGVEIDIIKSHEGAVSFEDIDRAITPRTRLVSLSQVQFLSGYRAEMEKIGELLKSKGIIFSADVIQAAGAMRVDVDKMKIDFLATGSQKWLMALQGLGFIFVTRELQDKMKPRFVGWTSVDDAWNLLNYDLTLRENADRFQNGTASAIGIAALNASLKFFSRFGYDKIEQTILDNSQYFISKLNETGLNPVLRNAHRKNLSGIVSFRSENAQRIFEGLMKENITAAVREGIVRFSPHFYNTKEEIDRVMEVLRKITL